MDGDQGNYARKAKQVHDFRFLSILSSINQQLKVDEDSCSPVTGTLACRTLAASYLDS
jgi:hypothetical protein